MTTIENQIAAAEAAADTARAETARLYAEKKRAEDAEKRARRRALNEFVRTREAQWPVAFNRHRREARTAFENSVLDGRDPFAAWIEYRNAEAIAAAEKRANLAHWNRTATTAYEAARREYDEISRTFITAQHHARNETRGATILTDAQLERHPNVAKANAAYNALAEKAGSHDRRDPGELREMSFAHLRIHRPEIPRSALEREDERTFAQALEEIAQKARETAIAEHRAERKRTFDDYATEHDTDPLEDDTTDQRERIA